jgi:hypothetical protein
MDIYETNNLEILNKKFKTDIGGKFILLIIWKYVDGLCTADKNINNCNITLKSSLK